MVRKSKQASGNATLTHHERRHKLTTDHGTLERRLAGHAQYQLGDCGLSLTPLSSSSGSCVLCSPSGHLYEDQAILEYLVQQTQQLKEQQAKADNAAANNNPEPNQDEQDDRKRKAAFAASQQLVKKTKSSSSGDDNNNNTNSLAAAKKDLKRTSYWLADAQPVLAEAAPQAPLNVRPLSPHSQQPLKRKDLWPVHLEYDDNKVLVCGLTGKPIRTHAAVAYWTTSKQEPGRIVLQDEGFEQLIVGQGKGDDKKTASSKKKKKEPTLYCPQTNQKIKYTRTLQRSGSSFATSGQATVVGVYRPTMT